MSRWIIGYLAIALWGTLALGQGLGQGKVSAALNVNPLQPGQQAVVAVVLDVPAGMHAQSHIPLASYYVALEVKVDVNTAAKMSPPIYPAGVIEQSLALGKISVYTGRVIVYVPIQVKENAAPGDLKITGTISYQVCSDQMCFAPKQNHWEVDSSMVPAGQKIQAGNAELFKNFDPTKLAQMASVAEKPAPLEFNVLGWKIGATSYFPAFLAALLIGVIFNIMPCVLPIVPLKAMGFYQVAQQNRARSLLLGGIFSLGIVAAFGVLATLVIGLRWLDWGKLFSYPAFTIAIVVVLLVLALQTFGVFEVILPQSIYRVAPSHETLMGNFLFGIFTAVLSTPCTFGMFLGLLIWASAQKSIVGVAVLMMSGVGMALPYLLLSAFPTFAQRLPRAGAWAELVKQMMGFLLVATAVYFGRSLVPAMWRGPEFWWAIFAVVAASGLFLVARTIAITRKPAGIIIAIVIALVIVAPAFAITRRLTFVPIEWQPYSADLLQNAQAANGAVLIDFTATWCGNCQALEATVFTDPNVVKAIHNGHVLALRADLTASDAPGWKLLRELNPVGAIPLTVVYENGKPQQLAGLYSRDDLLAALGDGK